MSDWDKAYEQYSNRLRTGQVDESFFRNLYDQVGKDFSDRVVNIYKELKEQRDVQTDQYWYGGGIGKENATWDFAFRLAETGVDSVYDIGQRRVERFVEGESGPIAVTDFELFNKKTDKPLENFNWRSRPFDTTYKFQFMQDGTPVAYTGNVQSGWVSFRENVIKPALPMALMAFPGIGQAIGTALTPAGTSAAVAGAVGAGVVGGTMAELTGGSFIKGAILGAAGAGATNFAGDIGKMIGLQGKMAEQVGNAIIAGARAELAGGDFVKGAALSGLISTVSNATGYTEKDIKSVISAVKSLEDPNIFKLAGAFSNLKNLDYFKEDKAADIINKIKTNDYGVKADYSLDLTAPSGSGLGFKTEGGEGLTMPTDDNLGYMDGGQGLDITTSKPYTPPLGDMSSFINKPAGTDTSVKVDPAGLVGGALLGQQLAKQGDKGPSATDLYQQSRPATGVGEMGDIYAGAPIKGFAMRKFKNAAGEERYIPFIGESAQLNIPAGFTPAMNKGGFISRRS